ncbi:MAG: LolA family protein [Spirochaetota bacterium]
MIKKTTIILIMMAVVTHIPLLGQHTGEETPTSETSNIVSVNYVKSLMEKTFAEIMDYTANIEWVNGDAHYRGRIRYKKANKILIEFEDPKDQVVVSNGNLINIYIPGLKVVVQQSLSESTESSLLTTQSEFGLRRLFDEYSLSFYGTSSLQPFRNTGAYHLKLDQKRPKVGFKTMDIWVSEKGLILQSNGVSQNGIKVSLTFSNIKINTEIPDHIFDFEIPADAQVIRNLIVPFSGE